MAEKKVIPLTGLSSGESGRVVEVIGGPDVARKLAAMGIRIGNPITKQGGGFFWGPLTVQSGGTKLGLGYGLAQKVMVEVNR